eukprot:COSAG01_NODE_1882_length_8990_cov_9.164323_3_plen_262_part_00
MYVLCREEARTKREIAQFTKQCPGCKIPTEKNAGCNHMTCCAIKADGTRCRTEWCWICNRSMRSTSTHYAWWNLCGCPGAHMDYEYQYRQGVSRSAYHCWLCVKRMAPFLLLPVAVAIGAVVVAVVLPGLLLAYPIWAYSADSWKPWETPAGPGVLLLALWPMALAVGAVALAVVLAAAAACIPGAIVLLLLTQAPCLPRGCREMVMDGECLTYEYSHQPGIADRCLSTGVQQCARVELPPTRVLCAWFVHVQLGNAARTW